MLKYPVNDYDIEVHNCSVEKFEKLMHKLGAKGVGKSFYVYKYKDIDISLPRVESKVSKGHRGFRVSLANDLKTACKRRDFTCNALMFDMVSYEVIDFFGGIKDIENKRLKIVDEKSFKDDSLRVLRAMQFCARLKFKVEKKSLLIMQQISIKDLSQNRIFCEFEKMFNAKNLHYGLYYMLQLGIAKQIFDKELNYKKFIHYAKTLHQNFDRRFYKYMFIYHLKKDFDFTKLQALPKEYNKCFKHPLLPKNITKRYILGVAIKVKIENFLGNYNKKVIQYAKELSVYSQNFSAISAQEVIAQGYEKEAIAKKIMKENIQAIRQVKE